MYYKILLLIMQVISLLYFPVFTPYFVSSDLYAADISAAKISWSVKSI
jgi:hypothetical protein